MHVLDAFKNAIVACFLGGTLGADLFLIVVASNISHFKAMVPVLGTIAVFLMLLIVFLVGQIRKSLKYV